MKLRPKYAEMRIPTPDFEEDSVVFYPLVRLGAYAPFGYRKDDEDEHLLQPIEKQLLLLEEAKKHVKQGFSLRDVANWLSCNSGRNISHQGLNERIKADQSREKEYLNAKHVAKQLLTVYKKAKRIEASRLGLSDPLDADIEKELFEFVDKKS